MCRAWWWLVRVSPVVLAGLSAYYLFFVIVPFFLLGVYKVPMDVLVGEEVSHEGAMGVVGSLPAFFLVMTGWGAAVATWAWLLSFVQFCRTRNWYLLLLLLLAALPIAYVDAGPYAKHIVEWIWGD